MAVATLATLVATAPAAAQTPGVPPVEIPDNGGGPAFQGLPAAPNPIEGVPEAPRHPFMAPNGRSNIHNDAYQTDAYRVSGPLGAGTTSSTFFARECASVAFDSQGRIVTVCVGLERPVLAVLDPVTLATISAFPLPVRNIQGSSNPFSDFTGGGYFFLDHRDRAVVSTNDRRLLEVAVGADGSLAQTRSYDLAGIAADDGIVSALPDWSGRMWFVTRDGIVGTVDRDSGAVRTMKLGEGVSNSFAVDDDGGVYIVSDVALYRFDANGSGGPAVSWRQPYPNAGIQKPGQSDAGSGTTPTLMGRKWVTITDNADPMQIQVYRRAQALKPPKSKRRKILRKTKKRKARARLKARWRRARRPVCSEAVFERGAGNTDQSLVVAGRAIITENNYGYSIAATEAGRTTEPGLARVDVIPKRATKHKGKAKRKQGKRRGKVKRYVCETQWTSAEHAPSVVPKLSLANGLVYTYTKPPGTATDDSWFFTALDFRTGATVYKRFAGEGLGFNNNYAPVTLGPDGRAYVGVLGGLVTFSP
ncbi:hypothetical protein BH20ACT15_BH20ACT15_11500 [soil metagenome]